MQRRCQLLHCLIVGYLAAALCSAGGCGRKTDLPDLQTQIDRLKGESSDDHYIALSNLQKLQTQAAAAVPSLRALLTSTKDDTLRAEIAQTLGVDINSVRSRLKRARDKMLAHKKEVMQDGL